jgi:hypothetical protein
MLSCGAQETVSLFDGKSLEGWHVACLPEDAGFTYWKAEDGAIVSDSSARPKHGYVWLLTDAEYGDFELTLHVQTVAGSTGNSGVQVRSRYDAEAKWLDGPQIDIHPAGPFRTGFIYDETRETKRWIIPSLPNARIAETDVPPAPPWKHADEDGAWNELRIRCEGTRIQTWVNGVTRADFDGAGILDDDAHRLHNVGLKGHIALQLHSNSDIVIRFKDLILRELK